MKLTSSLSDYYAKNNGYKEIESILMELLHDEEHHWFFYMAISVYTFLISAD